MPTTIYVHPVIVAATSLMITDLKVEARATFIETSWTVPRFLPYAYRQVVECSLLCDARNKSYTHQTLTKNETDLSTNYIVTRNLRASSRCKVTFKSIYNPASRDPGTIKDVMTPTESKLSNRFTCRSAVYSFCIASKNLAKLLITHLEI